MTCLIRVRINTTIPPRKDLISLLNWSENFVGAPAPPRPASDQAPIFRDRPPLPCEARSARARGFGAATLPPSLTRVRARTHETARIGPHSRTTQTGACGL